MDEEIARNPAREPDGLAPLPDPDDHGAEHQPRGTLVVMLIYLVIMIGIWGSVYLTLIRRA